MLEDWVVAYSANSVPPKLVKTQNEKRAHVVKHRKDIDKIYTQGKFTVHIQEQEVLQNYLRQCLTLNCNLDKGIQRREIEKHLKISPKLRKKLK